MASTPRQPMKSPMIPDAVAPSRLPRAADRDLALVGRDEIAGQAERDRKHAARGDAGENAGGEQQRKRGGERAQDAGDTEQRQAQGHQPRFAEQVGGCADRRLDQGIDQRIAGGDAGRGGDADRKILGDMRQHGVERPRRQRRREAGQRNDVDRWRKALLGGLGDGLVHQRVSVAGALASLSNAINLRSRPSNSASGTMFGPSEGA
jgi:hypothetical protein